MHDNYLCHNTSFKQIMRRSSSIGQSITMTGATYAQCAGGEQGKLPNRTKRRRSNITNSTFFVNEQLKTQFKLSLLNLIFNNKTFIK